MTNLNYVIVFSIDSKKGLLGLLLLKKILLGDAKMKAQKGILFLIVQTRLIYETDIYWII